MYIYITHCILCSGVNWKGDLSYPAKGIGPAARFIDVRRFLPDVDWSTSSCSRSESPDRVGEGEHALWGRVECRQRPRLQRRRGHGTKSTPAATAPRGRPRALEVIPLRSPPAAPSPSRLLRSTRSRCLPPPSPISTTTTTTTATTTANDDGRWCCHLAVGPYVRRNSGESRDQVFSGTDSWARHVSAADVAG